MKRENYINIHKVDWESLDSLTTKIEKKGFKSLTSSEMKDFLHLFRLSSHNLSYCKTHYGDSQLTKYLNSLVGRAHNYIYSVKRFSIKGILTYFSTDFPLLLKEQRNLILFSTAIFFLGFLVSFFMVYNDISTVSFFLPAEFAESGSKELGSGMWNSAFMSSQLMINNISVSFKAFIFGITLGIGTFYVLFLNGGVLGSLTAVIYLKNDPLKYWSLILPHGIIELTAIFISGAAGLLVAKSFLMPGDMKRKDSLIKGTIKGVSMFGGVCLMLVIAGLIEGFYTPLHISSESKLFFAFITAVILALYFALPYYKKRKSRVSKELSENDL